jgi:hypothetical protein
MLRDSADNSAHTEWRLGHSAGHTCKRESCHGKRSNAQQSRSKETEAGQEVRSRHFAFGRAAHPGDAGFVDNHQEALTRFSARCIRAWTSRFSSFQARDRSRRNRLMGVSRTALPHVRAIDRSARRKRFATQRTDTFTARCAQSPGLLAIPA